MHQLWTNYRLSTDHGLLKLHLLYFAVNTDYSRTTDTEFLLVCKSVNGPCLVTVIDLIELEFNDMSVLVGHFMSSQRKGKER